ncbi:hypothetical protein ABII15_38480 (plasmid) [Streptomyces sp. HUAS MG91]|uniref:FXSXX-COOH protein n=1 Tax=Streptomyces tabacisoli TaxID=3156398 RepID=A0AAU8J5Z9_9ACTN
MRTTSPTPQVPHQISQPHFALPAVLAAADPDPLELLKEIRSTASNSTDFNDFSEKP